MKYLKNEIGQGLTEYMILVMLVAIVCIGVTKQLGDKVKNRIDYAKSKIVEDINID